MGSSFRVPVLKLNRELSTFKEEGYKIVATAAGKGESLYHYRFPEKTCLLFGSEGQGVYFETGEQSRRYSLVSNVASFLPLSNRLVAVQACSLLSCFADVLDFKQKQTWQSCFDLASNCQVSGRVEQVDCENVTKDGLQYPQIYLDVGHNPHAASHLSEVFRSLVESGTRIIAAYSSLDDKDVQGIVKILDEHVDRWFVGELANERAMKLAKLQDIFLRSDIELTCKASFGEA